MYEHVSQHLAEFRNKVQPIKDNVMLALSTAHGYIVNATYAITLRLDFCNVSDIKYHECALKELKNGDNLFLEAYVVQPYFGRLVDILRSTGVMLNIYIMHEPTVPEDMIIQLLPHALAIFAQNNSFDHPKVHIMPLGIRDGEETCSSHNGFSQKYMIDEGIRARKKHILCLMCHSTWTHEDRVRCERTLQSAPFVNNLNARAWESQPSKQCGKVPVWINYQYLHESVYTLAPRGCGVDTHRFFEAIYLDTIPIVKRTHTCFDRLYDVFPCLVVNDWSEVTEQLLIDNKDKLTSWMQQFKLDNPSVFSDIASVTSLALQT